MATSIIPSRATLKFARGTSATINGVAEVKLMIPGDPTPNSGEGRFVAGGIGWFETPAHGDILVVEIQMPDGTVVDSYADSDVPVENSGWYIPKGIGYVKVKPLSLLGFIPSGLQLVVRATKAPGEPEDTFWFNVNWGKE